MVLRPSARLSCPACTQNFAGDKAMSHSSCHKNEGESSRWSHLLFKFCYPKKLGSYSITTKKPPKSYPEYAWQRSIYSINCLYRLLHVSNSEQLHHFQGYHVKLTADLYTETRPFLDRYPLHKLTERTFSFFVTNSPSFSTLQTDIHFITNYLLQNTTVYLGVI